MMHTKQISVFVENRRGRLAEITRLLAAEKINIRALSLADTAEFGVLRLIVNAPDRCLEVLTAGGFAAQETDVLAVEVGDRPGGLHEALAALQSAGLDIEYMYAFVEKKADNAIVVLKIDRAEAAVEALRKNGIAVLPGEAAGSI